MTFALPKASLARLDGVQPDLTRVLLRALERSDIGFIVTEGLRTEAHQAELVKAGASQTMNSRHITGHAVDVAAYVGGRLRWDWPLYPKIAAAMKAAAEELQIRIVWGGDWATFKDGCHFELDRRAYP